MIKGVVIKELPKLPMVERIFCCFPLTVGAFMIAMGTLTLSILRVVLIFLQERTCAQFEDKYLLYTCLVNLRYFCNELPTSYKTLFLLEIFLNSGLILGALCLLFGALFGSRVLVGFYLYWAGVTNMLRVVSYVVNIVPLYKTYTEQDFHIMLWGPIYIMALLYCWIASYSYLESIPMPVKAKK